jgi:peptidoglycan/LPS O-acetylase OafA/YrhL
VALPHVWSLAVEEQFYLFWPFLVAALSARALGYSCGVMILVALAARAGLDFILPLHYADEAAYTFTITRWDAIAFGALIAIAVTTRPTTWFKPRLVVLGLIGCVVALLGVLEVEHGIASIGAPAEFVSMPVTGLGSALLVLCCAVPAFAHHGGLRWIPRVFSLRPLAWVGKYSYALYVFHMPVHLVLSHYADHTLSNGTPSARFAMLIGYVAAVFIVSMILALISWHLLEHPMLSLKRYFPMPTGKPRPARA